MGTYISHPHPPVCTPSPSAFASAHVYLCVSLFTVSLMSHFHTGLSDDDDNNDNNDDDDDEDDDDD